jgi:hypothetical protein
MSSISADWFIVELAVAAGIHSARSPVKSHAHPRLALLDEQQLQTEFTILRM